MSKIIETIRSRCTIRQFQPEPVDLDVLKECVRAASLAPSAMNLQPLEYILVTNPEKRAQIFPLLKWAGYIAPAGDPKPGQEPMAYLVILVNSKFSGKWTRHDVGAAAENFILAAWDSGIGSCWIASVDREKLCSVLTIPESCEIDSIIALGYPAEEPRLEITSETVKYWKDAQGVLHVPKKPLDELLQIDGWNR